MPLLIRCNHKWPQRSRTWELLRLLLRLFYVLDKAASSPAVTCMSEAVKVAVALIVTYFWCAASNVLSLGKDCTSTCSHVSFMTDLHATWQVRALFGTWCALPVFAEFGKRPDLLFLMSADCTVRVLLSLSGAVQTRMQVATKTILPDITRLAEKQHRFFLGERLCECSSYARLCSSIGTVYLSLQLMPRLYCLLFFSFSLLRGTQRTLTVCPTAGAHALTMSSLMTWHPCHSGPALHCRVPFSPWWVYSRKAWGFSFFCNRRDELPAFWYCLVLSTQDSIESIATPQETDLDDEQFRALLASPLYIQERETNAERSQVYHSGRESLMSSSSQNPKPVGTGKPCRSVLRQSRLNQDTFSERATCWCFFCE